jgi:NAD(P)-dependent dehydrogenase (short-subunit alcohol dehydrogenase family)
MARAREQRVLETRVADEDSPPAAIVFGARNLGSAIIDALVSAGWAVAGAARSDDTLERVTRRGALGIKADVTDRDSVREAFSRASELGRLRLAVNAASPYGDGAPPFGGGTIAEAQPTAFDRWADSPARGAFGFLSGAAQVLRDGPPATIIQVTGGSARRAMPGRGLWAAGCFAVKALTQAAALELRGRGIQVCLLVVDAGIEPLGISVKPNPAAADPHAIAQAVLFLHNQGARAATHELQLAPLAERWVP